MLAEPLLAASFERTVDRLPRHLAVSDGSTRLTYRELDELANGAAEDLIRQGVAARVTVAVEVDRTVDLAVALLAVVKAGGCLLPLDRAHPAERRAFMAADAGASVSIEHIDRRRTSRRRPPLRAGADDPAYILYTSGSSGHPKGVLVEHGALGRYLASATGVTPGPRRAFTTSVGFSASVRQLLLPLAYGHTVSIASEEARTDLDLLLRLLRDDEVTAWDTTPSVLDATLRSGPDAAEVLAGLSTILVTGEALSPSTAALVPPNVALVNLYSQTETVGTVTSHRVEPGPTPHITAGHPLPGVRVVVLDDTGTPVADGEPGIVWIGGERLARGYVGRAAVAQDRFAALPDGEPGYRTGDVGRIDDQGRLVLLGREDRRANVAGMRVELGEVEATLARQTEVARAVVHEVDGRLRAVVVLEPGAQVTARDVLREASAWLPRHMVPGDLRIAERLPLQANGKLDWSQLPDHRGSGALLPAFEPAASEDEQLIITRAEDLLGGPSVGADDDLFAHGLDSLLATRLLARLRRDTGRELRLRTVFEASTPRALAAALARAPRRSDASDAPAELDPADRGRMSLAQQRLWTMEALTDGVPVYNVVRVLEIGHGIDARALEAALGHIVDRHDVLRATFPLVDDRPTMSIRPPGGFVLREETDLDVDLLLRAPFDLTGEPLLRATVVRRTDQPDLLVLVAHHIVCDAWSIGVLMEELALLLRGAPLDPLETTYVAHAARQRAALDRTRLDALTDHWRSRLAGLPPLLDLTAGGPRPLVQSYAGATHRFRVPERVATAMRRRDATPFMSMLTAFAVVVGRWSGRTDVAIGTPVAGRTDVDVEPLIGFFVNTLALRVDLSGDPTFEELLGRVRDVALDAHDHADLPFEHLVELLAPERTLGHSPLVQVAFVLQNAPRSRWDLPGVEVREVPADTGTSKLDLTLSVVDGDDGCSAAIEYRTDLFDRAWIERFAHGWCAALEALAHRPRTRIAALELADPDALRGPQTAVPVDCLHRLFEAQVDLGPERLALRSETEAVTYADLDARSNGVAWALLERGVGRDEPVAVRLPRSVDLVVAWLGVLKAGGAYVPIDPAYPEARRQAMVADAGARVVLDRIDAPPSTRRPTVVSTPDDLAYVIYTSGSTGVPKGVEVPHRGLGNVAATAKRRFGIGPGDEVLQLSSPSFDAATFELAISLLNSATLVVGEPEDLLAGLTGRPYVVAPPSVLEQISSLLPDGTTVVCAGERCRAGHVAAGLDRGRMFNAYGPTEATIWTTLFACESVVDPVPIGPPIDNVHAYVLDATLALVPVGAVGELYVGGIGVARGYRNRAALTAERFVPDPFHPGRLYRTGDRVRLLPGGALEFVGRVDDQVKVRGHRIEPGEVEAALPGTIVVEHDGRLVAYATAAPDLAAARTVLPEHMIPTEVVLLEHWPLTPNGKLDRTALPTPSGASAPTFRGATTDLGRQLAALWGELLGVDDVGIDDDFFALGGDSITAIHLVARARRAGLRFRARDVFAHPTIARLESQVVQADPTAEDPLPHGPSLAPDPPRPEPGRYVPGDFPAVDLTGAELDRLVDRLRGRP